MKKNLPEMTNRQNQSEGITSHKDRRMLERGRFRPFRPYIRLVEYVLFIDNHNKTAKKLAANVAVHLISSLAYAEACAVTWRMARDGMVSESLAAATINAIEHGIWCRINAVPDWTIVTDLA